MLYLLILCIVISFLVAEKIISQKRVSLIPIRIHVNGTRGKSSVTRLLAAALRQQGIRTLAKTTGTRAILIHPDGREEIIKRRGPSRIQEQLWLMKRAAGMKVEAVVAECMALEPSLQWASENQMIRSTIGVITNVRPDHFEVMGKDLDEIAESLAQTIPSNGILLTADYHYFKFFEARAAERNTRAILIEEGVKNSQELPGSRLTFRGNLSLVQGVCSHLEISPPIASSPIPESPLEPEGIGIFRFSFEGKIAYFIDAFSANDVESAKIIQQMALGAKHFPRPFVALLNNRADRPLRMVSFASFLAEEALYDYAFLGGDLKGLARRNLRRLGYRGEIFYLPHRPPEKLIEEMAKKIPGKEMTLVGLGNEKGIGRELPDFFRARGERWNW